MPGSKMRFALLLSSLLASACTVGAIPPPGSGQSGGTGTDGGGGASANGCVDRLAPPFVDAHPHDDGGTDNAGMDCTTAGCHLQGAAGTSGKGNKAPEYMFGGTVYKSDQVTPDGGAVVKITDQGMTGMYYADSGGNFFVPVGDPALPTQIKSATVTASACPNISPMAEFVTVSPGTGKTGCGDSGGGCHSKTGTSTGTGGKIFIPHD